MNLLSTIHERLFNPSLPTGLFNVEQTKQIPALKENLSEEPVIYEIIGNLIVANISKAFYRVSEPELTKEEQKLYEDIKLGLLEIINLSSSENPEAYIEKSTRIIISEMHLTLTDDLMRKILYFIYRDFIGLGKIEPLIRDTLISEILYKGEGQTIEVIHKRYGRKQTDILLNTEDIRSITRKLALHCEIELREESIHCSYKNMQISIKYNRENIPTTQFHVKKKSTIYPSAIELMKQRKVSPEILAYLWMLIEDKRNIYITKDTALLNALASFIPPGAKVLTNIPDYYPNAFTHSFIGEEHGEEDYALINNYTKQKTQGTLITSLDTVDGTNAIVCQAENGTVISITEAGKELFLYHNKKFLFSLKDSAYIASKGNRAILLEEFRLRTQLLSTLLRNNMSRKDTEHIIAVYYDNPVIVLKRAGIV